MRLAVAGQKTLQAQHVAIVRVADDDRPARAALQQTDTAQDQRPHDALAETGLLHHQSRSRCEGMTNASTCSIASASTSEGRSESCASSPDELPGPCVTIVSRRSSAAVLGDLDLAGQDDDQARRDVARRDDALAGRIGLRSPNRRIRSISARPGWETSGRDG